MAEWYYTQDGQQMGPISGSQLKALAASGGITREDLVWNQSLPEWAPAGRIRGLVFGASSGAPAAASGRLPAAERAPQEEEYPPDEPPASEFYEQAAAPMQSVAPIAYQSQGAEGVPATPRTVDLLRQTKPWVRLFSILMFIAAGLMVLVGSVALAASIFGAVAAHGRASGLFGILGLIGTIVYVGIGVLYAFPALFLGRYASRIDKLIRSGNSADLESALEAQRSFWKFVGIFTVVVVGLYLVIFALTIALSRH